MAKYHINSKGEPGKCSAKSGNCPFGSAEEHYSSAEDAQAAYEQAMAAAAVPGPLTQAGETVKKSGRPLPEELDSAARRAQREKNEAAVLAMEEEMDKIVVAHFSVPGAKRKERTPEDKEAFRREWRKGLLDAIEERTGEKWPKDTLVTVPDPDNPGENITARADELGSVLEPGEYRGYTQIDFDAEPEEATVAVYGDGTSRAFQQDLRDNLEYRQQLAKEKKKEVEDYVHSLEVRARQTGDAATVYGAAAVLLKAELEQASWDTPEDAAEALERIGYLEDEYGEIARNAEEDQGNRKAETYGKVAEELYELQSGAYELAGRGGVKLAPMRTDSNR